MAFLWTLEQAQEHARSQIGVSQCGATALLNMAAMLSLSVPSDELATTVVQTRARASSADALTYLVSRSVAGCTGRELAAGAQSLFGDSVHAEFLPLLPDAAVGLEDQCERLCGLLSSAFRGHTAVVATLNPQALFQQADAWHHQAAFGLVCLADGAGPHGDDLVTLTNPLEAMPLRAFVAQATTPSVLRVRLEDLFDRGLGEDGEATVEAFQAALTEAVAASPGPVPPIARWRELLVAEQLHAAVVAGLEREALRWVDIPAAYEGGLTTVRRLGGAAREPAAV
eukprot:c22575_g1_i1.p1 GENE.c22575_g1_i1~~c22575_g1_i1.p1  ORF type:complete len:284 (-),score=45.14 c22575_g1_i1:471-1322(-)